LQDFFVINFPQEQTISAFNRNVVQFFRPVNLLEYNFLYLFVGVNENIGANRGGRSLVDLIFAL
jgi:hypothetical protein